MRHFVIVLVLLVAACAEDLTSTPDASVNVAAIEDSFDVPVGAACDPKQAELCSGGAAWCEPATDTCVRFCAVVEVGFRCEGVGGAEHHERVDGADVCTCW